MTEEELKLQEKLVLENKSLLSTIESMKFTESRVRASEAVMQGKLEAYETLIHTLIQHIKDN